MEIVSHQYGFFYAPSSFLLLKMILDNDLMENIPHSYEFFNFSPFGNDF